jgi:hypothetical protein
MAHGNFDTLRSQIIDQKAGVRELRGECDEFHGILEIGCAVDGAGICGAGLEERGIVGTFLRWVEIGTFDMSAEKRGGIWY